MLVRSNSLGESSERVGGGLDAEREEFSDETDSVEFVSYLLRSIRNKKCKHFYENNYL